MIDLITGHQGLPHISAKQISDINNAMMEGYGADKVMRMKDGTITLSNDTFTVNPGYWRVNGYDMEIQETESITIERTTGNLKRYDDIYVEILRDIPSGAERAELVKVEGTPASSSPSHPAAPTEPELTTDTMLLCIPVGYVYATSTYTTKHDDTIPYHYVSETEYTELLTHLFQEQYSRARMSSGNFAPIRVDDIIKLNTKGTWTHTDPAHPGAYANDTYTLDSGNIVFQISSNELGLHSILVTTSSTSGYTEKLILFKGEVGIGTDNLWLPRNGSQVRSGFSAAAIVNGEEYSVGTGGFYVELPSGVLTELYIQATSGISENISFYPTIRYKDDPTYTSSYPPAPTNIMLWNEINDEVSTRAKLGAHNLLKIGVTSQVINGITYTVYDDGSVKADGTATADATFILAINRNLEAGMILSGCPSGGSVSTYFLSCEKNSSPWTMYARDYGDGSVISTSTPSDNVIYLSVRQGATVNNIVFYPMVRLASDTDPTFRPYAKTNKELTNDTELLKSKLIAPIQLTDLNSLPTDMGANNFSINFYNSSASNRPSDHSGIVFTFRSSSTYATQFAVANLENKIYVRYKDANNIAAPYWSSWNAIG